MAWFIAGTGKREEKMNNVERLLPIAFNPINDEKTLNGTTNFGGDISWRKRLGLWIKNQQLNEERIDSTMETFGELQ